MIFLLLFRHLSKVGIETIEGFGIIAFNIDGIIADEVLLKLIMNKNEKEYQKYIWR